MLSNDLAGAQLSALSSVLTLLEVLAGFGVCWAPLYLFAINTVHRHEGPAPKGLQYVSNPLRDLLF